MENIENFNGEITRYLTSDPKPYRIVGQHEDNATKYVIRGTSDPVPLRFAVLAGEIVHHLRCVLDHLIWALVIAAGNTPTKGNQFPVCLTVRKFEEACNRGMIKGLSRSAKKLVRSVQPYNVAEPTDHLLSILHSYDIDDKHRLLLVVTAASYFGKELTIRDAKGFDRERVAELGLGDLKTIFTMEMALQMGFPQPMREAGAELLTVSFASPAPHVEIEGNFAAQIAFEQFGSVKFEPVTPALVKLKHAVVSILGMFRDEF